MFGGLKRKGGGLKILRYSNFLKIVPGTMSCKFEIKRFFKWGGLVFNFDRNGPHWKSSFTEIFFIIFRKGSQLKIFFTPLLIFSEICLKLPKFFFFFSKSQGSMEMRWHRRKVTANSACATLWELWNWKMEEWTAISYRVSVNANSMWSARTAKNANPGTSTSAVVK